MKSIESFFKRQYTPSPKSRRQTQTRRDTLAPWNRQRYAMAAKDCSARLVNCCSKAFGADHVRRSLHEDTVSNHLHPCRNLHSVFRDVNYGFCSNSSLCSTVAGGYTYFRGRSSFVQRSQLESDPRRIHHNRRLAATQYAGTVDGLRTL